MLYPDIYLRKLEIAVKSWFCFLTHRTMVLHVSYLVLEARILLK